MNPQTSWHAVSAPRSLGGVGNLVVATFDYDALGRRYKKVDNSDPCNAVTTYYYYDTRYQVLCEKEGTPNSSTVSRYVYGNGMDELLIKFASSPAKQYYIHDHLNSTVALTDATGAVLERYDYDAYGQPYYMTSAYAPLTASAYGTKVLFTGRELDILNNGSLTLQYNRNRY